MKKTLRVAHWGGLLAIVVGAWLLGGCTTVTTESQPMVPEMTPRANTSTDETDAAKRGRTRMDLASAYFERGQMSTALEQIKLSIQADPTSGAAFNLRGLIYANLGDQAQAEESFHRALQINPRDADTMQNFGWYLCKEKRYADAQSLFNQALAVPNYRNVPRTLRAQGVCQARAGKLAEADTTLSRAYELDPANPATAVDLSEVLYRRGEYERARFYIRRVNSQQNVSNAQTLWLAARIEHRMGNQQGTDDFGMQLRNRFPDARETALFQRGAFDE